MSDEKHTTVEIILTAVAFGVVGAGFRAVRYARQYGKEVPFNWARFVICTVSASCASVLVGWGLESAGLRTEATLAAVGAAGYIGGPLLDMAYDKILHLVSTAFAVIEKNMLDDDEEEK